MTTLSTRHLPSGETAVLYDGTRIGTMTRATRSVATRRGKRPCVGFLIEDLAGVEIAWGSTYGSAMQRTIHEIEVREARARVLAGALGLGHHLNPPQNYPKTGVHPKATRGGSLPRCIPARSLSKNSLWSAST